MPRITEIFKLPDGRIVVALEPFGNDEGSVAIWTDEEQKRRFAQIRAAERESCAEIAESWPAAQDDMAAITALEIAKAIRRRKDQPW